MLDPNIINKELKEILQRPSNTTKANYIINLLYKGVPEDNLLAFNFGSSFADFELINSNGLDITVEVWRGIEDTNLTFKIFFDDNKERKYEKFIVGLDQFKISNEFKLLLELNYNITIFEGVETI